MDANELAKKIIDKMSTETVGNVISRVLQTQLPKEDDLRRSFEWAIQEVSKEYFLRYLKEDPQFLAKLQKTVSEQLTTSVVKAAVEKISERLIRGY